MNTKRRVTEILRELNIPPHVKGYMYLREAIMCCIAMPSVAHEITKVLYPMIAKEYETKPSRVERAVRHAVELGFSETPLNVMKRYFRAGMSKKPTNGEFIATIADIVRLEMEEAEAKGA